MAKAAPAKKAPKARRPAAKGAVAKAPAAAKKAAKYIYHFGGGKSDGDASLKSLLGGKGANLAEMSRRGFNVPDGFTVTT